MSTADILMKNLSRENRGRVLRLAQYFYMKDRIGYGVFLYIQTKPFF